MKMLPLLLSVCLLSSCGMPFPPAAPRNPAADVVLPMQLRAGTPHVMARINGEPPIPLLLDTGATLSIFEPDVATSLGLLPSGGRRVQVRGVHGTAGASQALMGTMDLGAWHATNVPCLVRGISSFRPAGLGSAILGMDHLRRHCSFLTIDYQRNCVELCFSRSFRPISGSATRTPLRWAMGMPVIRVSSGGISWDAVVDSGSTWGIVVDQSTAARLGHARDGVGMAGVILSGVGGSVTAEKAGARMIQVPAATLCGETHPDSTLYVMPGPRRVGSQFWRGTRLTVDFRGNSLWLER
ncbi:aspartyl protease family protein [Prosthecobacter sp.]|uniref:aspartyl protease family protein n=1 Tax=Prosthecobacter sp. TaxID=1965333 RepID=UPI003783A2A2